MLFSLANFLKSLAAKLISQHFYKWAKSGSIWDSPWLADWDPVRQPAGESACRKHLAAQWWCHPDPHAMLPPRRTAHIAKVKAALEQEYFLLSLSKRRPTHAGITHAVLPSLAKISTGVGEGPCVTRGTQALDRA